MLAGHALTGCGTAAACYGTGKVKMLSVLKHGGSSLELIGNVETEWPDISKEATKVIEACYGQPKATSMSEARVKVWTKKVSRRKAANTPPLANDRSLCCECEACSPADAHLEECTSFSSTKTRQMDKRW